MKIGRRKPLPEQDIFLGFSDAEISRLVTDLKITAQEIPNYNNTQLKNLRVIFSSWVENTKHMSYIFSVLTIFSALIAMLINAKFTIWVTYLLIVLFCFLVTFTIKTITELMQRIKPAIYIQRLIDLELEKRDAIRIRKETRLSRYTR
ncbi:hypothetical protein [Paenibacillus qinlingensis]|uniref:hypothetical protein n=1 Tax=Paenibacillus qinlingensis TaxID=1837343 RepID=UPI001563EA4D|nr:hypothetical protein [Paenibacillus qinlingensis]NQX63750.1 hypothetical protein [Paenibacillus qinlingensis]